MKTLEYDHFMKKLENELHKRKPNRKALMQIINETKCPYLKREIAARTTTLSTLTP